MSIFIQAQPLIIIAAALMGLLLGSTTSFGEFSVGLIEPFLMVLLFFVFLSVYGQKFKTAFRNLSFTLTATAVNFLWTPIFTLGLGWLFFADSLDLQMGLMMLMVTPCTDWYLVFTKLAGGNVELGASILPLNLLLQILLLPVYLLLFFGSSVNLDTTAMLMDITYVLVIPLVAAILLRLLASHLAALERLTDELLAQGDNLQLLFLCLAVIAMFASESQEVAEHPLLLLRILLPLVIFFAVNFLLVRLIGRKSQLPAEDITALNFTTLARNSPLSLAIAAAAFPDRPLIALALVIGPLIELPALSIIAHVIKRLNAKKNAL